MGDLLFLALTLAFFVVFVAYVGLCDRIIGPDPHDDTSSPAALDEAVRS